jgi:hypothetical protein
MWYLTRGTGIVALILLTLSVALGVVDVRRLRTPRWPRFVLDAMHRNVSLLALAFLLVHIVTSVLDSFASIRLLDAVLPFTASYRPLWLGLGALGSDLLIALVLTSLLRRRLGYRAWRTTHWLAYACWPLALVHGLGTGSDTKAAWVLLLNAGCVLVVLVAVWTRATAGWPEQRTTRGSAIAASAIGSLALLLWLPSGPLAAGWARRSGTPSSLLFTSASSGAPSSPATPRAAPFSAQISGTVRQGQLASGAVEVELALTIAGQQLSALDVRIEGDPVDGGGVQMTASAVTLGTSSAPTLYRGTVTGLEGANIAARVTTIGGASMALIANLNIGAGSGTVTGTVNARPTP